VIRVVVVTAHHNTVQHSISAFQKYSFHNHHKEKIENELFSFLTFPAILPRANMLSGMHTPSFINHISHWVIENSCRIITAP
jgi:hypothetical protein